MTKNSIVLLITVFLFTISSASYSSQVDTLVVYSTSMDKEIRNLVILPANYNRFNEKRYPVVYLLHGYGGNYKSWSNVVKKNLPDLSTKYDFIIVCPDGQNSWYWDSPINKQSQYETYMSKELLDMVDSLYATDNSAEARAISGFSMGGHGALWLTINHPKLFGACGSTSGGVDIRPFPNNWDMYKVLGKYSENKEIWDNHTVITQIDRLKGLNKAIIIDCGQEDFFFKVNQELHQKMIDLNIDHVYRTSSGGHTPDYWRKSIEHHLTLFDDFFRQIH